VQRHLRLQTGLNLSKNIADSVLVFVFDEDSLV